MSQDALDLCLASLCAFEFDWIAVDSEGAVALCLTAGFGDFPEHVLRAGTERCEAYRSVLETLGKKLPRRGLGRKPWLAKVSPEDRELGARGIFVFDWKHWAGPYRRVMVPTNPIQIDELLTAVPGLRDFEDLFLRFSLRFSKQRDFQLPDLVPSRKPR